MLEQEGVGNMGLELTMTSSKTFKEFEHLLYIITGCSAHVVLMMYWSHRKVRKQNHSS
jgi:hypothetical protein